MLLSSLYSRDAGGPFSVPAEALCVDLCSYVPPFAKGTASGLVFPWALLLPHCGRLPEWVTQVALGSSL